MIYILETYDGHSFELTEPQYRTIEKQIDHVKFLTIGNTTIAASSVKAMYPDWAVTQQRKEEEKSDMTALYRNVTNLFLTGNVEDQSKENLKKLKRIWFEHVKRRPAINERMRPAREKAWEYLQKQFPPTQRKSSPRSGFDVEISPYEQKIIDTPIEELMKPYN